ncbi:hypothetical protein QBK93_21415 [Rhizobium leguminosarum]|uniref:hypothetical protein n=1 Tax=Rhizobium leguminosarum TaxID=384 RepID=UPI0024A9DF31|nr:hypothetical protein [Rhizobium leguminosarum]MDI5927228.1 hypothetical protein [Rhizobium leguminosarum]
MSERLQRRSFLTGLWAALSAMFGAGMPAAADNQSPQNAEGREGRAGIHPWLGVGEQVTADVVLDGKVVAQLNDTATLPGLKKLPALVFNLPPGLKRLQLHGSLRDAEGRAGSFSKTWTVRDMAPISATLYDCSRPLIERVRLLPRKPNWRKRPFPGCLPARRRKRLSSSWNDACIFSCPRRCANCWAKRTYRSATPIFWRHRISGR